MKRQLIFDFVEGNYVIKENASIIFTINGSDLQFDARKFYDGIYKGENCTTIIDFMNEISSDSLKKGKYIFQWISDIITAIQEEFQEICEQSSETVVPSIISKIVILYDMAACAGNGLYIDNSIQGEEYPVVNEEADYAVKISGHSMEPTIPHNSIVLVKLIEQLEQDDIGIFNIDGDSMCKRYTQNEDVVVLVPDNESEKYQRITITSNMHCIIQGKVIETILPMDEKRSDMISKL